MGAAVALEAARLLQDAARGVIIVDAFHDPAFKFTESLAEGVLASFRASWADPAFMRSLRPHPTKS